MSGPFVRASRGCLIEALLALLVPATVGGTAVAAIIAFRAEDWSSRGGAAGCACLLLAAGWFAVARLWRAKLAAAAARTNR